MGQDPDHKSDDKSDAKSEDKQPDPQQLVAEPPEYPAIGVVDAVEGENPDG
jgi:hypothetical protein